MTTTTTVGGVAPHRRLLTGTRYVLLSVFAIPWIVLPVSMLLINSFKTEGEASTPSLSLPTTWNAVTNYASVFGQGDYLNALKNSLVLSVPAILLTLFLGSMAAWAYARTNSVTLRTFYYLSSLSIVLPPAIIPTVFVLTQIGLNGTMPGYLLTILGTRMGAVIFLATGFVRALPDDFEEAAQLDGASRWKTYWHVVLPLLSPLLFTAAVMLIISIWNDFFFALFLLPGQGNETLPLALYQFANSSTYGIRWNLVFADVVLTSIPLLVAYVVLQRRVLAGLTEGGVTG